MNILQITSTRNEKMKRWRKLSTRKGREEYGSLLIEGEKLLIEAIKAGWQVRSVLVSERRNRYFGSASPIGRSPCLLPIFL